MLFITNIDILSSHVTLHQVSPNCFKTKKGPRGTPHRHESAVGSYEVVHRFDVKQSVIERTASTCTLDNYLSLLYSLLDVISRKPVRACVLRVAPTVGPPGIKSPNARYVLAALLVLYAKPQETWLPSRPLWSSLEWPSSTSPVLNSARMKPTLIRYGNDAPPPARPTTPQPDIRLALGGLCPGNSDRLSCRSQEDRGNQKI